MRDRTKDFVAIVGVSFALFASMNETINSMIVSEMTQSQSVKDDPKLGEVFDSFCHFVDPNADGVIVKSEIVCDDNLGMKK